MAISKIILNGTTQMDLTADTIDPTSVLSGHYGTGADGVRFEGTASGGGGGGLEYEEGTYTPASDVSRTNITFTNSHSTPPSIVYIQDMTNYQVVADVTASSNIWFIHYSGAKLFNQVVPWYIDTSSFGTAYAVDTYGYSTASRISVASTTFSDSTTSSGVVDETGIYAWSHSTSRYWKAGKTYKWVAIWT